MGNKANKKYLYICLNLKALKFTRSNENSDFIKVETIQDIKILMGDIKVDLNESEIWCIKLLDFEFIKVCVDTPYINNINFNDDKKDTYDYTLGVYEVTIHIY